jgi:hypothetical protein
MTDNHATGRLEWSESPTEANMFSIGADGKWLMHLRHNGEQLVEQQRVNFRRMVACWNACRHISTQSLEENGAVGFEQIVELRNIYERAMKAMPNAEGKTA